MKKIINVLINGFQVIIDNLKNLLKEEESIPPVIEPPIIIPPVEPTEPLNDTLAAARGKGAFLYYFDPIYKEEGGIDKAITWFKYLGLDNVWMRIVGKSGWSATQTKEQAKELIKKCKENNINVGAWGFIYDPDEDPDRYADYVIEFVKELDLNLFVHNMEYDHEDDNLSTEIKHAEIYWKKITDNIPNVCHGLSSYWNPDYHNLAWNIHMNYCSFIAPQAYWVNKDPIEILQKAINLNCKFNRPIVLTSQAFWGEMGITESGATNGFKKMCENWNSDLGQLCLDKKVIGVNMWHAGGQGFAAMNETMEEDFSKFNPILFG